MEQSLIRTNSLQIGITYLNVDQGDCIVLDWVSDLGTREFGIVDCNYGPDRLKRLKSFVKDQGVTRFKFVILSHPHTDHFSGFLRFLPWCKEKGIQIEEFIHTNIVGLARNLLSAGFRLACGHSGESRDDRAKRGAVLAGVNRNSGKRELNELMEWVEEEYRNAGIIRHFSVIAGRREIPLNKDFVLEFLSPRMGDELDDYLEATVRAFEKKSPETKLENNPYANSLSTVGRIKSNNCDWQYLLTGDTVIGTLSRLENFINDRKVIGGQIPHHGSGYNHNKEVWDRMSFTERPVFMISAGQRYGHPQFDVVKYFLGIGAEVHCTNLVNGFLEAHLAGEDVDRLHPGRIVTGHPGMESFATESELEGVLNRCCSKRMEIRIDGAGQGTIHVQDLD